MLLFLVLNCIWNLSFFSYLFSRFFFLSLNFWARLPSMYFFLVFQWRSWHFIIDLGWDSHLSHLRFIWFFKWMYELETKPKYGKKETQMPGERVIVMREMKWCKQIVCMFFGCFPKKKTNYIILVFRMLWTIYWKPENILDGFAK